MRDGEDRSQRHQVKLPLIFQARNGEDLYFKSRLYLEKMGGGQFDTFGDFLTEGADVSGWMITVDTYGFVYLEFCVFTEKKNTLFLPKTA